MGSPAVLLESRLGQQVAQAAAPVAPEHVADQRGQITGQRLPAFEQHVADKAIAHHDVDRAGEDVPAFDVADEVEPGLLEHPESLPRELRALAFLLADRHQADPRSGRAEDVLSIEVAHDRELTQVGGSGAEVGPHVEEGIPGTHVREHERGLHCLPDRVHLQLEDALDQVAEDGEAVLRPEPNPLFVHLERTQAVGAHRAEQAAEQKPPVSPGQTLF